jgi:ERCC4-type nuclease
VKSEIGNSILANALHFKQIHLILESVSPEMALNNLKIDPFTPPVIKELEFYHVLATNILKPQFGSNLNIWYSDTDRQTAWIIRKCSDQSPCNMDWLKDIPSKQEQFLSLFPGINEASAQYLLSQHSIAEIARLDKETLLKFTDKIHASSLDTFYKYLH